MPTTTTTNVGAQDTTNHDGARSWPQYLDQLDEALRALHKGASWVDFPSPDGLGPLPEELWGRAQSLLNSVLLTVPVVKSRRAGVASRLAESSKRRSAAGNMIKV